MRKHLSVLMLFARSSIYKIMLLLVGVTAGEVALFYWKQGESLAPLRAGQEQMWALEQIIRKSHLDWVCAAGFVLLTVILCMTGCERGSKVGYTFQRLRIAERYVFLWQMIYNLIAYLIYWAVQVLLLWGLSIWYMQMADQAAVSGQTIFLAFYRNEFLHGLFPMSESIGWARNIFLWLGLGVTSAAFPFRQRRGSFGGEIVFLGILTIIWFDRWLGDVALPILTIAMVLFAGGTAVCYWLTHDEEGGDTDED